MASPSKINHKTSLILRSTMVPNTLFLNIIWVLLLTPGSTTDNLVDRRLKSVQKRQALNEVIDLRWGRGTPGIGGTNTPTPTPAGEYIRIALEEANAELQFQKNLDRQMLLQGVDQAPGGHSYFWHLGRFLYTKNREKVTALSDKAWVSVQVTKKLVRIFTQE
ncbi:hypothetical protein KUTeg_005505 [Tegillarca granosa]|uniref:Uncharacterized protein n=1 Tax=Tegillarca granosa TaxID=220873 RepID=A0ABQ9FJX5_TEGGR|nr:hypothetical protein KUTeg_005505 [Tegillarca granosa]